MTHTQKAIGIVAGVILLLILFHILFNSPASRRLEQLRLEAEELEQQVAEAEVRLIGLADVEQRIAEARSTLDRMEVQYPRSVEVVYQTITEAARETGFKISRRETSERPDDGGPLRVFEINIIAYSPYRVLGEFLDEIVSSPMLISVSFLSVSSDIPITIREVDDNDLRVDLQLTTYLSKSGAR